MPTRPPCLHIALGLLLLLLLASPSVFASNNKWSVNFVDELTQKSAENPQQFLARTAAYLRDYTIKTGYEACGFICKSPTRQAVMLFTGKSQITCPLVKSCPAADYAALPLTIHSHPPHARVILNAIDADQLNLKRKRWHFKKKPGRQMTFIPGQFSNEDYDSGPGYMVDGDHVWQQWGRGTQRLAFTLPGVDLNPTPTPSAVGLEK